MEELEYGNEAKREEYKRRVQKQKLAIDNLLEIAGQHTRLFSRDMLGSLKERRAECERLYRKLDKNEFEIAIVGLEKAGKSTFANALIGNRILPEAQKRCTYTSTCIRYGTDGARVTFYTQKEFDKNFQKKLKSMGFQNVEQYSVATLRMPEYQRMFASLGEDAQKLYEMNIHQDILNILENSHVLLQFYLDQEEKRFGKEELKTEEFRKYIIDPNVAIAVKDVLIESSALKEMENAIIYDVPGFDSPTRMHEEQTVDKMKKADVIVLIASAEKPSFTAPALNIFNKAVDEDNVELCEKLFIFGNRVDGAITLEENIGILQSESLAWNLLRERHLKDRLLIGSAKAHLQMLGQEEGDDCLKRLQEDKFKEVEQIQKYGDGIRHMYDKLVEYNMTERFRILKRKVNQNDQEIRKIFGQLREEYGTSVGCGVDIRNLIKAKDELYETSCKTIIEGLQKLRENIRDNYTNERPLSDKMEEEIARLFEDGKYDITDEDIEKAKRKISGVVSAVNVEKVEMDIRDQKFREIYQGFSDTVLRIAMDDHTKHYEAVVTLFEQALQVNPKSSDYAVIQERIGAFVQKYKKKKEDVDSYQALIERFVRDLVEVLIERPYGSQARLNRFLSDSNIFIGLVMFYGSGKGRAKNNKSFMTVAPKDQPLLYALLFHEYRDSLEVYQMILDYVGDFSNEVYHSAKILQIICNIIKSNPKHAYNMVKSAIVKQDLVKFQTNMILHELAGKLQEVLMKMSKTQGGSDTPDMKDYDFTNQEVFKGQYTRHFGNMKVRDYEDVKNEYAIDLEILKKFLVEASISAISVEKPFVAKEVRAIESLMYCISETGSFSNFITENLELLMKEDYREYESKQSELLVNQTVVKEIESVLNGMSEE